MSGKGGHGGGHGAGYDHDYQAVTTTSTSLTSSSDTLTGTAGSDVFIATSTTFNTGDSLDGGAGRDILKLTDAGTFDLNTLVSFTNIEEVQGAASDQTIVLKDGASLHLTVGKGTNVISTGATGVQSIDLGTGTNTVNAYAGTPARAPQHSAPKSIAIPYPFSSAKHRKPFCLQFTAVRIMQRRQRLWADAKQKNRPVMYSPSTAIDPKR